MKIIIAILSFLTLNANSQSANWSTGDEHSITRYEIQKSSDTLNWVTIDTIKKGQSIYAYTLPLQNIYYRIKAAGIVTSKGAVNFYTKPIFVKGDLLNKSVISSMLIKTSWFTDKLTWATAQESNVSYYLIEKSTGSTWSTLVKVTAKGNSNYSYTNSRGWFSKKPTYRIGAVYKDGKKGVISIFK